ncbi:MAG: acyl-CoA thioesterase [Deltaproteobacteria bacterium]|nr:acyl-CoA thioesterase [Deltaproteobacteria bacterium]
MPRIRLKPEPVYEFSYHVTLKPRDMNYGGHLGNDTLVTLAGEARAGLFKDLGFSEGDLGDGQMALIMGDLAVNYRAEGFLYDELLIESHVGEITRNSMRIFHRITKKGTLVALAETGVLAFDYRKRRIGEIPHVFMESLKKYNEAQV